MKMRLVSKVEFDRAQQEHIEERRSRPTNFPEIVRRAIDEGILFPAGRARDAFNWMILGDTEVEIRLPATLNGVDGSVCIGFAEGGFYYRADKSAEFLDRTAEVS